MKNFILIAIFSILTASAFGQFYDDCTTAGANIDAIGAAAFPFVESGDIPSGNNDLEYTPSFAAGTFKTGFYSFSVPTDGYYNIHIQANGTATGDLSVGWDPSVACGLDVETDVGDVTTGFDVESMCVNLTAGTTYTISMALENGHEGTFEITIDKGKDVCEGALQGVLQGDNVLDNSCSASPPSPAPGGTIWTTYTVVAGGGGETDHLTVDITAVVSGSLNPPFIYSVLLNDCAGDDVTANASCLNVGDVLYIESGNNTPLFGDYTINIVQGVADVENDDCVDADDAGTLTCSATVTGAADANACGGEQDCSGNDVDGVWYHFVASSAVNTFDFTGSDFRVWTGSDCANLTELGCDGDIALTDLLADPNTIYWVMVWGAGNFKATSDATVPANDLCTDAVDLTSGTAVEGSTFCANGEWTFCALDATLHEVYYKYTNSNTNTVDLEVAIASSTATNGTSATQVSVGAYLDCSGAPFNGIAPAAGCDIIDGSFTIGCIDPGETIILNVGSAEGTEGDFSITVTETVTSVTNDVCGGAGDFGEIASSCTQVDNNADNTGACSDNFNNDACDFSSNSMHSVWYTFSTDANAEAVDIVTDLADADFALYEGADCDNLNYVSGSCTTDGSLTGLTINPNTTYWILIGSTTTEGTFNIGITVKNPPEKPTGDKNQYFCADDDPTVDDLSAMGKNILWYSTMTASTPLETPTDLINGEDYFATQTVDGCESQERLKVIAHIYNITGTTTYQNPSNCGVSDGYITINSVIGGSDSYKYKVNNENWQSDTTFNNLEAGIYNVWVKNMEDPYCETIINIDTLTSPSAPSAQVTTHNPDNCGTNTGWIKIDGNGGINSYDYSKDDGNTWVENQSNPYKFNNIAADTYTLKIRNSDNTCETDLGNKILEDPPTPEIISIDIVPITMCGEAGKVTINASITGIGNTIQFALTPISSTTDIWQNSNVFIPYAGHYIPKVRNKNATNCTNSGNQITLSSPPLPQVFSISNVQNTCLGTGTVVEINSVDYERELIYDLSISNSHNNVIVIIEKNKNSFTIPQNKLSNSGYTKINIKSIKNTETNCTNSPVSIISNFTVYSIPITNIILSDKDATCKSSPYIQLNGNPNGGSNSYQSHMWSGNGVAHLTNGTVSIPMFKTDNNGLFKLQYKVKDSNGCWSTFSEEKTLTIYPKPKVNPISPLPVCQKESPIQLSGKPSDGTPPYSHLWIGETNQLNNTNIENPKFTTSTSGVFDIQYIVQDNNSCSDTSKHVTITIHPKPEADYIVSNNINNIIASNLFLEKGIPYKFKNNSKSKETANTDVIEWIFEGADPNIISTADSEVINFWNQEGKSIISLMVKNNNCRDTIAKSYNIVEGPFAHINIGCGNEYSTCSGSTICFNTSGSSPRSGYELDEYLWTINGESFNKESIEYQFSEVKDYTITLKVKDYDAINGFKWSPEASLNLSIQDIKTDADIPNISVCSNLDSIDLKSFATGKDVGFIKFFNNDISGLNNNTGNYILPEITHDTTIVFNYTVQDGLCVGKNGNFILSINRITPVYINILENDGLYCIGDTLVLKNESNWNWNETSGLNKLQNNDSTIKFAIVTTDNPTLKVSKEENGCKSKADSILHTNSLPIIPNLSIPPLCNGASDTLNISLGENEFITWNNYNTYIYKINDIKYEFRPNASTSFNYTIKNSLTTCFIDSTMEVEVIQVAPVILPVDSCGGKMGNIFAIKNGSIAEGATVEWEISNELGEILEGQNTYAIIIDYNDIISSNRISVEVEQAYGYNNKSKYCTGGDAYLINNIANSSFLNKNNDTTLIYNPCGALVYNDNPNCTDKYYIGYIDHKTGEYFRADSENPYLVDTTRNESSNRTYFINCSDCNETNILTYREVEEYIDSGCDDDKNNTYIYIYPNPASNEFNVKFEGKYKGKTTLELYNSIGSKVKHAVFNKTKYNDSYKLDVNFNSGIYFLKIFINSQFITVIPVAIMK